MAKDGSVAEHCREDTLPARAPGWHQKAEKASAKEVAKNGRTRYRWPRSDLGQSSDSDCLEYKDPKIQLIGFQELANSAEVIVLPTVRP